MPVCLKIAKDMVCLVLGEVEKLDQLPSRCSCVQSTYLFDGKQSAVVTQSRIFVYRVPQNSYLTYS